jgi:hypothetical protein
MGTRGCATVFPLVDGGAPRVGIMDELQQLFDDTLAKVLSSAPTAINENDISDVAAQVLHLGGGGEKAK